MSGYVGVLDCQDLEEIYLTKLSGKRISGKIRTQNEQDIYELNHCDLDTITSVLDNDNVTRQSTNLQNRLETSMNHTNSPDEQDPDTILYV